MFSESNQNVTVNTYLNRYLFEVNILQSVVQFIFRSETITFLVGSILSFILGGDSNSDMIDH